MQSACRVAGTCPYEGAAEQLPQWPPTFDWGRLERKSPWSLHRCAPTKEISCGCPASPAARSWRRCVPYVADNIGDTIYPPGLCSVDPCWPRFPEQLTSAAAT